MLDRNSGHFAHLIDLTKGEINRRIFSDPEIYQQELKQMRPESYLINVARGQVVREASLVESLQSGHLRGVGLDVTEIEPLPESSLLWEMPNVLITPHVGAQSADRVDVTTDFFCDNLTRFREGKPLRNRVDKNLGFPAPTESQ